jgi:hypothetical protein
VPDPPYSALAGGGWVAAAPVAPDVVDQMDHLTLPRMTGMKTG